ncbi:hypothetical protein CI109_100776 [Kwoniella shandongensis]|uniref:CENP-C homolog n=1 Tax=Kwoniella shandongensis TaxID=1734106 RepID=A0A5M6BYY9_9TREE|nr:uncharacterized protein CI109_005045 [Kwoniella shandongensis]KAA5526655.1 hypothetical protein CI109_005045 [Kwoniella shandongensis]
MAQTTPGRRARDDKYTPFNPDPKNQGTRSQIQMPKDVPRTADGYEDPSEFFRSPGTVIDPDQTASFSTFGGGRTPKTPAGGTRSTYTGTPGTGQTHLTPGTGRRTTRGRMSDLDGAMEDDEDGMQTEDLLVDEDDLEMATPGQYFPSKETPSVSLPSRSRLAPSSPQVDLGFDNIPSPSRRTRSSPRKNTTIGVNYKPSPAKSALGRLQEEDDDDVGFGNGSPGGLEDVTVDDLDEAMASQAILDSSPMASTQGLTGSPVRKRKSPERTQNARKKVNGNNSHDQDEDDDDVGHARDRLSMASRRSNVTRNGAGDDDEDVDDSDNDNAPDTFHYDDTLDNDAMDLETNGGDASLLVDDIAGGGGSDEDEDGDAQLEEQAMAADEEERSGDEEEEEPAVLVKKRGRPKKAPQAARTRNRSPSGREGSVVAKPKRTRVSQIGAADEDRQDGYHGDFVTRRSHRQHFKPLAFWRGEHFEYQPGPGLAVIKEVVQYPQEAARPLGAQKRGRSGRSVSVAPGAKSKKRGNSGDTDDEDTEEGWDNQTDPTGIIVAYPGDEEIHRKIAAPKKLLEPKMVQGGTFKYQKVFGEGQFMAAGVVYIPPGQKKATKPSKDNAYVFHVIQGAVQVTIHRTSFVMAPGGQFLVPRGNEYCIENISVNKEVQLFFAQARKIRAGEEDMDGRPDMVIGSSVPPRGGKKGKTTTAASGNESEAGSGEETEQEVKTKKGGRKSAGKRR